MIEDVIEGLKLIAELAPRSFVYAEHDIILTDLNDPNPGYLSQLEELNWFYSNEYDCWCKFV